MRTSAGAHRGAFAFNEEEQTGMNRFRKRELCYHSFRRRPATRVVPHQKKTPAKKEEEPTADVQASERSSARSSQVAAGPFRERHSELWGAGANRNVTIIVTYATL